MPIITISRGSYSRGKEVAEKLAQKLGYDILSRDILIEASEKFNIPEIKLVRAIHDAPSVLERFTYGKERYVAYIRATLLKHVQKDNVVYHGSGRGITCSGGFPTSSRCGSWPTWKTGCRKRCGGKKLPRMRPAISSRRTTTSAAAGAFFVFGIDTWDPMLYDMVLHIKSLRGERRRGPVSHVPSCPISRPPRSPSSCWMTWSWRPRWRQPWWRNSPPPR